MEEVRNWLRGLGLEQYAHKFEKDGWDTLEILQHMRPSDIEACIDKPGHRRKFEIGIATDFPKENGGENTENDRNKCVEDSTKTSTENIVTKTDHKINTYEKETDKSEATDSTTDSSDRIQIDTSNDVCLRNNELTETLSGVNTDVPISTECGSCQVPVDTAENDNDLHDFHEITSIERTRLKGNAQKIDMLDNKPALYTNAVDAVCVTGARNKIILPAVPTESSSLARAVEVQHKGTKIQTVAPAGLLAEQITRSHSDGHLSSGCTSTSGSDSENEDLMTIAKVNEMQTGQHLLARNTAQPVKKATIVSDSRNVTIAHRAEVHHHHHKPMKKEKRDNFKDQIANVVESFKRKDHLFVETKASKEVEDIISDRHWALITGKPGDGKSSMAAHLMLKYKEKGFEPIILTNAQDWKELVKGKSDDNNTDKQFAMIDDMFGSMSADDKKVNEWVSIMEVMQRVIKMRKGNLVVVCTSRAHVFYDVKAKFEKFSCFPNASCVDMTQKMYELTCSEKRKIWITYTEEYKVDSSVPDCVYNSVILPHGFPHCVELYCSNQFLRQQGVAFFENPMQFICKEIQNFKENDKIKFCLLLLILFNGNRLEEGALQQICLSDPSREVMKIFKAAGLSSDHAQSELKKALGSLRNTYVYEELDNSYRFSHESIRENVAFMYIKDNPLHAIEEIDLKYLVDHTRCHGHTPKGQENIFVLPSFCTNALVERMIKEIESGQIELVCQHQAWNDHVFITKFVEYALHRVKHNESSIEFIHSLLFTRRVPQRTIRGSSRHKELNLIEMLIYSKHITALTYISRNEKIKSTIQSHESIKMLSHALVCACFLLPDRYLISCFLQMGANINIVLSREDVQRYSELSEHRYTWYSTSESEIYNPLLCTVLSENVSSVSLLMDLGGSVFIGEEPIALIAAVKLNLPKVLKVILEKTEHSIILRSKSVEINTHDHSKNEEVNTVAIWNCKFSRFIAPLNCSCVLSPVHLANSAETVKELAKKGARINEDVIVSGTRMPHCVFRMILGLDAKCFQALLKAGMDATGSWMGSSCLHFCMQYLPHIESRILYAMGIIRYLISYRNPATVGAIVAMYRELLLDLILKHSQNSSIGQVDMLGNTALHYLLRVQTTQDDIILPNVCRAMFYETIRQGADVNAPNNTGITPVMNALTYCTDTDILRVCVAKRTPLITDNSGRGYFHYLAKSKMTKGEVFDIVKMLMESGEDINQQDKMGNIAGFGCNFESLLAFFMARARLDIANNSEQNIMFINLMRGIDEEGPGIFEIAKHIVPNINVTDTSGRTPMHCLMSAPIDEFYRFNQIFDVLFEAGCDPVQADKNGVTPLMLAGENPSFTEILFEFLLDKGLDFSGIDCCGMSVLHYLLKSKAESYQKENSLLFLLDQLPSLFEIGCDIVAFAIKEMECSMDIVEQIINFEGKKQTDCSRTIMELLTSSRSENEKISCLSHLKQQLKVQLPLRNILICDVLSNRIKGYVANFFLNEKKGNVDELVVEQDDILKILNALTDDLALEVLKQIEGNEKLRLILSNFIIDVCTLLCKQNFTKSLTFLVNLQTKVTTLTQDGDGNTILHRMVEHVTEDDCLVDLVRLIVDRRVDISISNKEMMTALHVACKARPLKPKSICLLIEYMSDVDQQDNSKTTPLQYLCSYQSKRACKSSCPSDAQINLAICLIGKGADVDHQNIKGQTVIMSAIHERLQNDSLVTLLIENSNDINKQDVSGNTVLHRIARSSLADDLKASIIESILRKGGDMTIQNKDNETCLDIYTKLQGHGLVGVHVFATLIPFVNMGNESEISDILFSSLALFKDERFESLEKMKEIVVKRQVNIDQPHRVSGSTLMMVASESLLPDAVRALLTLKANPNVRDMIGCTCLTRLLCSIKIKYTSILHACYVGGDLYKEFALQVGSFFWNDVGTTEFLQAVANAEVAYSAGDRNCLRIVKQTNSKALDILQTLLSAGADPNILDISGKSPLHHYVQSPLADIFICPAIKMLIDHGANVNENDFEGMTPLMACSQFPGRKSRRLNILIAAGAHIREVDYLGRDAIEYGKMAFCRMNDIHRK